MATIPPLAFLPTTVEAPIVNGDIYPLPSATIIELATNLFFLIQRFVPAFASGSSILGDDSVAPESASSSYISPYPSPKTRAPSLSDRIAPSKYVKAPAPLAINNAGTIELAISRTSDIFQESNLVSTTAIGTGSDSSAVMYSTSARSNVACRCIGYIEITTGATPGEWDNDPLKLQIMTIGVKRTGEVVQMPPSAIFTGTQDIGNTSTWTAVTSLAITLTPTSVCNKVLLRSVVHMGGGAANCAQTRFCAGGSPITALMPTSPGNRPAGQGSAFPAGAGSLVNIAAEVLHAPASVSAQAYTVEAMYTTNNGYINRSGTDTDNATYQRSVSTFTVMEISA